MAVKLYTPDDNVIVHQAKVDFRRRIVQRQVNLVQYDKSMPIIAVQLYSNGNEYVLPENASAYIRFGKRDHTYVYNECLGCDQTRTIVYFAITDQMTIFYGEHTPIVELRIGDTVAGSGSIPIWIDRNPIQNGDTESKSDLSVFEKAIEAAQKINVKLPTDLKATATNLSLLAGATKIGSGINLSGFEYDEATKTLKAKGGVSPCLNLTNTVDGVAIPRTSITEEEKTNLEKGLYNSVIYGDSSLGNEGIYMTAFPENLTSNGAEAGFSVYNVSEDEDTGSINIVGSSMYALGIGEKSADGTYPIAIEKQLEFTFGKENVTELVIKTLPLNKQINSKDGYNILSSIPDRENIVYAGNATVGLSGISYFTKLILGLSSNVNQNATGDEEYCNFDCIAKDMGIGRLSFKKDSYNVPIFKSFTTWLPPVTANSDGKALIVTDGNAQWTTTPRYEHTVTIKNSAGAILWTQTMRNSSNTVVNSYTNLKTLFGGATYAGFGEYCQLNLEGGTEATDKLIKADGTEVTLASLGAIVYTDKCFLPK